MTPLRRAAALLACCGLAAAGLTGAGAAAASGAATAAAATTSVPVQAAAIAPPPGIVCTTVRRGSVTQECVVGRSRAGRAIVAVRQGDPEAARVLLVSGQMHGEEWPGPLAVDVLRTLPVPADRGWAIWSVRTMNPDGGRLGRRWNDAGVDLNTNWPARFRLTPRSGPRAMSEPESQAMARLLRWLAPDLVVSLHGFTESVDTTGGGLRAARARWFASLTNLGPAQVVPCTGGPCHGNMTDWYTATSAVGGVAFTVEMPRSSLRPRLCKVPGHRVRMAPVRCVAWAVRYLAPRLSPGSS